MPQARIRQVVTKIMGGDFGSIRVGRIRDSNIKGTRKSVPPKEITGYNNGEVNKRREAKKMNKQTKIRREVLSQTC